MQRLALNTVYLVLRVHDFPPCVMVLVGPAFVFASRRDAFVWSLRRDRQVMDHTRLVCDFK